MTHRGTAHRMSLPLLVGVLVAALAGLVAMPASAHERPTRIALPKGFAPEDITAGPGSTFYVGSLATGAIYQGDFRSGRGHVLVPSSAGPTTGLFLQRQGGDDDLLWAAGGPSGQARVYDAATGALLRTFQLADPASGSFVSDAVVTKDAAYYTDSFRQQMYVIPLTRRHGRTVLPAPAAARTVPLTGDVSYVAGANTFNLNGIAFVDHTLVMAQTVTGQLFSVDPGTGRTTAIPITDKAGNPTTVNGADGLAQRGNTLFIAQNFPQRIATVKLGNHVSMATVTASQTDPRLDIPSSVAESGGDLFALNARFTTPPTADTTYDVIRL